jgi:lysophospholipase L1-like esterase
MKARFNGTSVSATLTGSSEWYVSTIDGGTPNRFLTGWGKQTYALATNLSPGVHEVILTKDNEGAGDTTTQFFGFTFGGGQLLAPATINYPLRLEFVGDSITCGAWNLGTPSGAMACPSSSSPWATVLQFESATASYAQQTASLLQAPPATNICYSGRGLVNNNDGSTSGTLPQLYPYIETTGSVPYSFSSNLQPNVVVINLGTNDWTGNSDLQSGSTQTAAYNAFVTGYEMFIATIRKNYPQAHIICAAGPLNNQSNYQTAVQAVVSFENAAGDSKVHYLQFAPPLAKCNSHPTEPTDTVMAKQLAAAISALGF